MIDEAAARMAEIEAQIEEKCQAELTKLADTQGEKDALKGAIDAFVLLGKRDYDDGRIKITRVQGHTRKWNVEKLSKLVPRSVFKNITTTTVVPAKVDEYVRKGKIKAEDVADAYEESKNQPYTKWTTTNARDGEAEAASLANALA